MVTREDSNTGPHRTPSKLDHFSRSGDVAGLYLIHGKKRENDERKECVPNKRKRDKTPEEKQLNETELRCLLKISK